MVLQWYGDAMRVTIDGAGRVVIPKSMRQALGLSANSEIDIVSEGGGLRLDPVDEAPRSIDRSDGLVRLSKVDGPVITDDDVRALRDELQR